MRIEFLHDGESSVVRARPTLGQRWLFARPYVIEREGFGQGGDSGAGSWRRSAVGGERPGITAEALRARRKAKDFTQRRGRKGGGKSETARAIAACGRLLSAGLRQRWPLPSQDLDFLGTFLGVGRNM